MQIVVRQISGLGNQLFQYSAGLYFAKRYRAELSLLIDHPERSHSYGAPRPFLLREFTIPTPMRSYTLWDKIVLPRRGLLQIPSYWFKRVAGMQEIEESVEQRYTFLPELPLRNGIRSVYLFGYWQAHQFANAVEPEVRASLQFKRFAEGKTRALLQEISSCEVPVSLHIRRGDYTLAAEGKIALPFNYYEQAISMVRQRWPEAVFFVFSDDIAYARERIPAEVRAVFVSHNDDLTAHDDLRLMAACHHHVIANSSFSWWGAWLNPRAEKWVIAPKYWKLKPESYYPDLTPPAWTLLEV